MIAGLTFDEGPHLYTFKGQPVPSVTQILTGLGLIDDRWFTPLARERGTAVHAAIHYHLEGDLDWTTLSNEILPYVEAAIKFLDDSKATDCEAERIVYHPVAKYAGKLDVIGEFFGEPGLIDWKSGGLGDTIGLQTSGYEMAVEQESGPGNGIRRRRFGVQLRKSGTYKIAECSARPDASRDRQRFLSAVDLYRTFVMKGAS